MGYQLSVQTCALEAKFKNCDRERTLAIHRLKLPAIDLKAIVVTNERLKQSIIKMRHFFLRDICLIGTRFNC